MNIRMYSDENKNRNIDGIKRFINVELMFERKEMIFVTLSVVFSQLL